MMGEFRQCGKEGICCPFTVECNTLAMSSEIREASQFFYNKTYISQRQCNNIFIYFAFNENYYPYLPLQKFTH
jgi:hypothetical protein